ncbi:response regulator [Balneatrix alpica]|uniref:Response regulator n=1 Tax=Balneatrix alpica TaxID=75684 RepID=A0ABV5ZAV8_9GAMM|nr:response regulator [Balneatrix alpica]
MLREGTILLVEDNPDDELLTRRALLKNNISNKVVTVRDGQQALDYFSALDHSHPLPVLVLLDLNLPALNGHEVLKYLRQHQRTRTLPVVVLTTSNEEADINQSYSLGANSFVRKPVDFDSFIDSVGSLGRYWLEINHPPQVYVC